MRWRWPLGALFLTGCVLWLFAEVIFQGKVLYFGDLSLYFLPQLAFERAALLAGRIPLWNPYLFCGQPFVGNPQTWPLYPSAALLWCFEAERASALGSVAAVLWLALGMSLFLRQRGLGAAAAFFGALVFSCGGAVVSKAQFPNMLQAESWLPWLLWGAERVLLRPRSGRVAVLGLCGGLAVLAAHAQISMMQFYLVLAWCLWRLPQTSRGRGLAALVLAGLLSAGLAAGQLVPLVEHVRASVRPELSLAHANRFYLPLNELWLLVSPNHFGNPATQVPWQAPGNFWEPCSYLGLIPLGLCLLALLRAHRLSGEARFWLFVVLVGLWLALGRSGGLYSVAFRLLPGVKQFHDPARFLYIATFGMACLSAQELELRLQGRTAWKVVVVIVAAADLIPFARTLNPVVSPVVLEQGRVLLAQRLTGVERLLHTEPYRPWRRWVSYRSYRDVDQAAEVRDFIASATPNLPLWVGVRQAGGYEPVVRRDVSQVLRQLGPLPQSPGSLTLAQTTFLEQLGVDLVIGYDPVSGTVTERALLAPLAVRDVSLLPEARVAGWRQEDGESRYDPVAWRVGVFLSLGTACILVALMTHNIRSWAWQT